MNPLDLYSKIEPLIGFYEQYESLYTIYLDLLKKLNVKSVLDVGCGNGKFLKHLQIGSFEAQGIDRSVAMVEKAIKEGVSASTRELSDFDENSVDSVVAIADVVNYIAPKELELFFEAVARVIKSKGYFVFDVNTLYGFEEVADGVMHKESDEMFLCVEATYHQKELLTKITLFEKENDHYHKSTGQITQYFHAMAVLKKQPEFKFVQAVDVTLFGDKPDKTVIILQKR